MTLYWPRGYESRPAKDFSRERARREAGNSAPSGAGSSERSVKAAPPCIPGHDGELDLFGEIHAPAPTPVEHSERRRRPARRRLQPPQAEQEPLEGIMLPFTGPIPARVLARSIPPWIEGARAQIEPQADEALEGSGVGGTLAEALPFDFRGDLRVVRLTDVEIDLRHGPVLKQTRPQRDTVEIDATSDFWDLLACAAPGDRHEIDGNVLCVFLRGCTVWWSGVRALFWFALRREIVDLCQDYFRNRDNIRATVEWAEKAEARAGDFALRFEDRQEWNRRNKEKDAARAELDALYRRYGHHPLYPPHYL